ncbi:hypothetical protein BDQ17DRAFT_1334840 [Cyathus striatus]|nr:hypothetical protein BDQ17DRAFT_1334840 [Cyathus striatus]
MATVDPLDAADCIRKAIHEYIKECDSLKDDNVPELDIENLNSMPEKNENSAEATTDNSGKTEEEIFQGDNGNQTPTLQEYNIRKSITTPEKSRGKEDDHTATRKQGRGRKKSTKQKKTDEAVATTHEPGDNKVELQEQGSSCQHQANDVQFADDQGSTKTTATRKQQKRKAEVTQSTRTECKRSRDNADEGTRRRSTRISGSFSGLYL